MAGASLAMMAYNKITLTTVSGHPGDEVEVSLTMENTDGVTALEVTIPLADALKYVSGSCSLNAARSDGHQVSAAQVDGELRIYVYSIEQKLLKGNDGKLLSFRLKLGKEPASYALTPTVLMSDTDGTKVESAVSDGGTVTLLSPKMELPQASLDMGHVAIKGTYSYSVAIRNSGNEPLHVGSVAASDATVLVSTFPATVEAGRTEYVQVEYKPVEWGAFEGKLTIESDAVNGAKHTVSLVADPYSVNELHVSSPSGTAGEEVTVSLTMNNMEPIVAMQCEIPLPEALVYVDGSAKMSGRGSSHSVSANVANGVLKIYAYNGSNNSVSGDDGELLTFKVRLNGNSGSYGLYPQNVVLSNKDMVNMTSATYEGWVSIASPSLSMQESFSFGNCPVTDTSRMECGLNNYGDAPLVIEKITFLSEGYTADVELPMTIEPWGNGNITVCYTPTKEGEFATTMQVYTNDPNNRMKSVSVSGTVYEPNNISLAPTKQADESCKLSVVLDNYSSITALQFDMHGVENMTLTEDMIKKSPRLENHSVVLSKLDDTDYRVLVYSANNTPVAGNSGELMAITLKSDTETMATVRLDNIVISNTGGKDKASTKTVECMVEYWYKSVLKGDANGDGAVNAIDLSIVINKYLGKDVSINMELADMNDDRVINAIDVSSIVQKYLSGN